MALTLCSHRVGGNTIFREPPKVADGHNVYYLPLGGPVPERWGIYDSSGRLLPFAGFYRGPNRHLVQQAEAVDPAAFVTAPEAPDHDYVYGGAIQRHYGHFLLATLSRYWVLSPAHQSSVKIIVHAGQAVADWFAIPHIAFIFGQLGLTEDNFVSWTHPVRLRRITVPEPSFEELSGAHLAFARLGHSIGESAVGRQTALRDETPVYLCKSRLSSGVWRIRNEEALAERLSQLGVDIVYPEQLSLPEQIGLFQTRVRVLATVSSGLHTSILAPDCATIIGLNHDASVVSNYSLIDAVGGYESHYYFPKGAIVPRGSDTAFSLNFDLVSPRQTAEALLRVAEAVQRTSVEGRNSRQPSRAACLDSIGLRHGSDRSSKLHDLLRTYEPTLRRLAGLAAPSILEIGSGNGSGLAMLAEYLPSARINGIDNDLVVLANAGNGNSVHSADQGDPLDLTRVGHELGPFDLVLDDGSHQWDDQITSFKLLFPLLNPGGIYIIEQLQTSFSDLAPVFRCGGLVSPMTYLSSLCNAVVAWPAHPDCSDGDAFTRSFAGVIESVSFKHKICVICRKVG